MTDVKTKTAETVAAAAKTAAATTTEAEARSAAAAAMGRAMGKTGFMAKAMKFGKMGLKIGGGALGVALLIPTILDIADRFGADIWGVERRRKGLVADDISAMLDSDLERRADKYREQEVTPAALGAVGRMHDGLAQSTGFAEANADLSFENLLNSRAQRLAAASVPQSQQPTLTELAARLGLPV